MLPSGDSPPGARGRHEQRVGLHLDGLRERRVVTDDPAGMVEDDLRAVVVEGRADDVLRRRPTEEPPEPHDGAPEALPVAAGHTDPGEPMAEAAIRTPAGRAEGVLLPVVESDAEAGAEGENVVEHGRVEQASHRG